MAKKVFGGNTNFGAPEFWPTVRKFRIDLNEFWVDESYLKGQALLDAYNTKLEHVERVISDIQLAMLDVRLSLKQHVQQYQLPFSVGVSGKKFDRTLAIQWRIRKTASGTRSSWIQMTEWPKRLAEANISENIRQWYSDTTSVLIILNSQSMTAYAVRNTLQKSITHVSDLLGIRGSDEPNLAPESERE